MPVRHETTTHDCPGRAEPGESGQVQMIVVMDEYGREAPTWGELLRRRQRDLRRPVARPGLRTHPPTAARCGGRVRHVPVHAAARRGEDRARGGRWEQRRDLWCQ